MEEGTGTLNVPTKERVIARVESARASTDMKEKLAAANLARMTVLGMELVNT